MKNVGVIGAGTMGQGIANAFATLLKKMVRAGKLGQKTKQGFYSYN